MFEIKNLTKTRLNINGLLHNEESVVLASEEAKDIDPNKLVPSYQKVLAIYDGRVTLGEKTTKTDNKEAERLAAEKAKSEKEAADKLAAEEASKKAKEEKDAADKLAAEQKAKDDLELKAMEEAEALALANKSTESEGGEEKTTEQPKDTPKK